MLAEQRPIFHSEADFQHALAWAIHEARPDATVRLEIPRDIDGRRAHVDIWVVDGEGLAIELKYLTTALDTVVAGERFQLRNQAAQDLGRYDILKDLARASPPAGTSRSSAPRPRSSCASIRTTPPSGSCG